jgi:hypothetical protein
MGRTPSKKKRCGGTAKRAGPRDPRQHVYSAGVLPISTGRRRGTHGGKSVERRGFSLPPIINRNADAVIEIDSSGDGGVARAGTAVSLLHSNNSGDEAVVVTKSKSSSHRQLRDLISYHGDENPGVHVRQALLKSRMVEQMKRKANSHILGFQPDHFKTLIDSLNGIPPKCERRDQLAAMAMQAGGVDLMNKILGALPKTFTRKTKKPELAAFLVDTFFVIETMVASKTMHFPSTHSGLGKALSAFIADLVRVRNYCRHDLENEKHNQKALKSEPITGELWREGGLFAGFVAHFSLTPLSFSLSPCTRGRVEGALDERGHQEPWGLQRVCQLRSFQNPLPSENKDRVGQQEK